MTFNDNKLIARRLIEEVWNKGDVTLIDELVDPGYEGHDPVLGTYKRDGLTQAVQSYRSSFPDLKLEIVNQVADDRFVVTRWIARGTHLGPFMGVEPTKKFAVTSGIDLTEVRDGKIYSDFTEYDSLGLLKQLGVAEKFMGEPPRATTTRAEKRT